MQIFILQELVALNTLKPTMDMVSDADYINQCVAVWIADSCVTYSAIIDCIR